ncbi:hypothetical protein ACH4Q6_08505 [Streptomyces lydicus]|uniref:hypothetical protein n=1 Tax=Streptomyces lydicus TaxID=47763 RepID=UPI0037AFFEEB
MKRLRLSIVSACAVVASNFLSGCSVLRDDPEPKVNVNQAVKQVDAILDKTFDAIHPRLKWREGPAHMSERRNSFTNTADGEVSVDRDRYVRTKFSKAKLKELLTVVYKHWAKEGFKLRDSNPRESSMSATASDGSIVSLEVSGFGGVRIGAGVGALSDGPSGDINGEEGDNFPKAPDGGPDYTPDVRDPYWSK